MDEWVTGKINLTVKGAPVEMELTVPASPVKLRRMLPILQMLTNSFVGISTEAAENQGKKISCQAGCGACCRQAVPLAEVEAYQIAELVENLPEPRRSEVKKRFADGVKIFHENKWFERMNSYGDLPVEERQGVVLEYFYENVPCPFLENESCSIHTERPLACREYLVTTPPEECSKPTAKTVRPIEIFLEFSKSLRRLSWTQRIDSQQINFVPLIRALEWAATYPETTTEKPGQIWMEEVFRRVTNLEIPDADSVNQGD